MQEDRKTQQEGMASSTEKPKLEIEISRYKGILDMIADTRKLAKLILVMAVVLILVFAGVTAIVLIVKKFYPYNTVNTNKYGATVIESEKKDVIYWLFNSADLWANSGIEVKAGDVISVQTSGSFHTAIHNLVKNSKENVLLDNPWMSPDGGFLKRSKDIQRSKYRISSSADPNEILMQVIPAEYENRNGNAKSWCKTFKDDIIRERYVAGNGFADIYIIGGERRNIRIQSDGILHFAVNDVAFTSGVLLRMIEDKTVMDSAGSTKKPNKWDSIVKAKENDMVKGKYADTKSDSVNEFVYYYYTDFVDAWYVDNVGSFLVAIEREKRK